MEQNEKLKEALVKLRDFSVNEKQEATKKIKELEKSAKLVPGLTGMSHLPSFYFLFNRRNQLITFYQKNPTS